MSGLEVEIPDPDEVQRTIIEKAGGRVVSLTPMAKSEPSETVAAQCESPGKMNPMSGLNDIEEGSLNELVVGARLQLANAEGEVELLRDELAVANRQIQKIMDELQKEKRRRKDVEQSHQQFQVINQMVDDEANSRVLVEQNARLRANNKQLGIEKRQAEKNLLETKMRCADALESNDNLQHVIEQLEDQLRKANPSFSATVMGPGAMPHPNDYLNRKPVLAGPSNPKTWKELAKKAKSGSGKSSKAILKKVDPRKLVKTASKSKRSVDDGVAAGGPDEFRMDSSPTQTDNVASETDSNVSPEKQPSGYPARGSNSKNIRNEDEIVEFEVSPRKQKSAKSKVSGFAKKNLSRLKSSLSTKEKKDKDEA